MGAANLLSSCGRLLDKLGKKWLRNKNSGFYSELPFHEYKWRAGKQLSLCKQ